MAGAAKWPPHTHPLPRNFPQSKTATTGVTDRRIEAVFGFSKLFPGVWGEEGSSVFQVNEAVPQASLLSGLSRAKGGGTAFARH